MKVHRDSYQTLGTAVSDFCNLLCYSPMIFGRDSVPMSSFVYVARGPWWDGSRPMTHHSTVSGRGMASLLTNQPRLRHSTGTGTGLAISWQPDMSAPRHCGRPGWAGADPARHGRLEQPDRDRSGRVPYPMNSAGPSPELTGASALAAEPSSGVTAWRGVRNAAAPAIRGPLLYAAWWRRYGHRSVGRPLPRVSAAGHGRLETAAPPAPEIQSHSFRTLTQELEGQ